MSAPPPLILVVEDDADILELSCDLLEGAGYTVAPARNGDEALLLLATLTPALILTDLMMPVMDGLEFVLRLRGRPELAMIPVVLITGSTDKLTEEMRGQFDRCLSKPISPPALLDLVSELTTRARHAPLQC